MEQCLAPLCSWCLRAGEQELEWAEIVIETPPVLPKSWQRHPLGQQGVVHELRFCWSYVAGMLDSDGSVSAHMDGNKIHASVRISQSNPAFLAGLRQWLLLHNILAVIRGVNPSPEAKAKKWTTGRYTCGDAPHELWVRHCQLKWTVEMLPGSQQPPGYEAAQHNVA